MEMYGVAADIILFPACFAVLSLIGIYFWIRKEVSPNKRNKGKVVVSTSPAVARKQKEEPAKRSKRQVKKDRNREKEKEKVTEAKKEKMGIRSPISIDLEVVDMN